MAKITRTFRIDGDLIQRFDEAALIAGVDKTSVVTEAIEKFVEEVEQRENKQNKDNLIDRLYNAGYDLKEILGREKARRRAWELNSIIGGGGGDLNKFVEKVIELHVNLNIEIPKEILETRSDVSLAQAFVLGMLGDKRKGVS